MQSSSKGECVLADAGHDVDADRAKPNCGWFLVRRWCEKSKQYIPMQVALCVFLPVQLRVWVVDDRRTHTHGGWSDNPSTPQCCTMY